MLEIPAFYHQTRRPEAEFQSQSVAVGMDVIAAWAVSGRGRQNSDLNGHGAGSPMTGRGITA